MLLPLLTLVLVSAPQEPAAQAPNATTIVQRMLARYHGAERLIGEVTMTQRTGQATVTFVTRVQFDKPSKLWIEQRNVEKNTLVGAISDGTHFTYDPPSGVDLYGSRDRYTEAVKQGDYEQNVRDDMYPVFRLAATDRSPILDVAFGRRADLEDLMAQWAEMKIHSRVKIGDVQATAIVGRWRANPMEPISGAFEAYITDDLDFIRYVVNEKRSFVVEGRTIPLEISTVWNSTLKVNSETRPELYHVPPPVVRKRDGSTR
jgi:hypothetical protein